MEHYLAKLSTNGMLIFEGGSKERDKIEWINNYNKPKIQPVIEKYKDKVKFLTLVSIPSITLIYYKD